jgi:hypothetical protein
VESNLESEEKIALRKRIQHFKYKSFFPLLLQLNSKNETFCETWYCRTSSQIYFSSFSFQEDETSYHGAPRQKQSSAS